MKKLLNQQEVEMFQKIINRNAEQAEEIGKMLTELSQLSKIVVEMRRPDRWIFTKVGVVKDNFEAEYTKGLQLGQPGQYGVAHEATHKVTKQECAVKIIDKSRFFKGMAVKTRTLYFGQFKQEIEIMKQCEHDNLIKLYDVFENKLKLFLVMEKCTGGELFVRIQNKGTYCEKDAAAVLQHLGRGIEALHKKKIAHCDLKPENCLFLNERDDSPLKLIDFGMSKYSTSTDITGVRGSTYYIAPEIITNKSYTYHCDMWSFGIITFVMLFGFPPFYSRDDDDNAIFEKIKSGFKPHTLKGYGNWFPRSSKVTQAAKDFIAACLQSDITKRYTATEALMDPWLTGQAASSEPLLDQVMAGLTQFTRGCKLRALVLNQMTDLLSKAELTKLEQTFKSIDIDGNGLITKDELKMALEKQEEAGGGLEVKKMESLLEYADVDGDGQLSYQELIATIVQRKMCLKEERIWEAFCRLDLNGDGHISMDELKQVFQGEDTAHLKELISDVDKNNDGVVDYDEFLAMWKEKEVDQLDAVFETRT